MRRTVFAKQPVRSNRINGAVEVTAIEFDEMREQPQIDPAAERDELLERLARNIGGPLRIARDRLRIEQEVLRQHRKIDTVIKLRLDTLIDRRLQDLVRFAGR